MAIDRLLEYVNGIQQKRMGAWQGFENAMHNTPLLYPLLHVDHAYQEAVHGCARTDDPMTNAMLFQARVLQDKFLERLGKNLTINTDVNPFWYSGQAVPMRDSTDMHRRQPWLWAKRVQEGRSKGVWGDSQKWDDNARDFIDDGFWPRFGRRSS